MKSYSQNHEDLFVLNYFGSKTGTLLEIGANDGVTLSNSKLLIEHGWDAHLLEPGLTYYNMNDLHRHNHKVKTYNYGIGEKEEQVTFYESGAHVPNGNDRGLVSTTDFNETLRWPNVEFFANTIQLLPFDKFWDSIDKPVLDFISIDAEGMDWAILQQIDLEKVGCKCLCVEHNGDVYLKNKMSCYAIWHGMKQAVMNAENLIFVR